MDEMPLVTIYRPNQRHELGFLQTWVVMSRNVIRSRELIWQLFRRDFLAGFKKSFLGKAWLFIAPLIGIVSWVFYQRTGLLQPGDVGIPYPAYVLIGSSMWGLFMGIFAASSNTLASGSDLIMQVNYPHEALLFKQIAQHLADFSIGFAMNVLILLVFGIAPSWKIIFLPVVALPLFFLSSGLGLLVAMISAVAIDVKKAVDMLIGLLILITPVVYSNRINHDLVRAAIRWNPLTYLVCSLRDLIIYGRLYDAAGYAICAALSVVWFLICWRVFYVSENILIERMV